MQSSWSIEAGGRLIPLGLSGCHGAGQGGPSVLEGAREEVLAALAAQPCDPSLRPVWYSHSAVSDSM